MYKTHQNKNKMLIPLNHLNVENAHKITNHCEFSCERVTLHVKTLHFRRTFLMIVSLVNVPRKVTFGIAPCHCVGPTMRYLLTNYQAHFGFGYTLMWTRISSVTIFSVIRHPPMWFETHHIFAKVMQYRV